MTEILSFQIVDIISDDIPNDKNEKSFIITLYGIDSHGSRIVCHVKRYNPYFYIKVPNTWDSSDTQCLLKDVCGLTPSTDPSYNIFSQIKSTELCFHKEFYGVRWNHNDHDIQIFNFLKISMNTHDAVKKMVQAIKKHFNMNTITFSKLTMPAKDRLSEWRNTPTSVDCESNLYESSIHPIIKFIHDTKIDPTGWVSCIATDEQTNLFPTCKHEYFTQINDIKPLDKTELSSYRIASFDIECDSSHGDFPQAHKNFKKVASDVFDSYQAILKNSPESRRIGFNDKIYDNLKKLIIAGFTGDVSGSLNNSIWKYASMNKIKIMNNEEPTDEFYDDIIQLIRSSSLHEFLTNLDIKGKDRDNSINQLQEIIETECNKICLEVEGDPIIQIGTVFYDYGTGKTYRHILVSGNEDNLSDEEICSSIDDIHVQRCKSEKELLLGWKDIIKKMDPDFITGYNIFGFDFKYIYDRAVALFPCPHRCKAPWWHVKGCPLKEFLNLGKIDTSMFKSKDHKCKKCDIRKQQLTSSALGENTLHYIMMDGRILFDIQKEVQKGHNLESYKLDNVASHFIRGKLKQIDNYDIEVSDTGNLKNRDYISFRTHSNIGEELFNDGNKYEIKEINNKIITLFDKLELDLSKYHKVEWCLNKDDITPQEIFDNHKRGGPTGRAMVAKYCVQDCELCINLLLLLDIIPNNLGMANVSYVPASFIFLRGQGVKVTSVVSRICDERDTRIPELKKIPRLNDYIKMIKNGAQEEEIKDKIIEDADWRKPEPWELEEWYKRILHQSDNGMEGYEGAVVLDPKPGIYLDDPIAVLDYASLYPSSIIEKNISHETYIEDISLLPEIGENNYHTVEYQDWIYKNKGKGDSIEKIDAKTQTKCHFLKPEYMIEKGMFKEGEAPMGIIPAVLNHLLSARKETKKLMKQEPDEFKKKVLDGLQLAYKVTANSVYGQLGAKTSTVFKMNLAACTTSIGRSRIDDAKNGVQEWALKKGYEEPDIIYGDTDSVFVKFGRMKDGKLLIGKEALRHCIQCGQEAGEYITKGILKVYDEDGTCETEYHDKILDSPQDLEYEKTFWPFILISKKRYTGDKYEFNTTDCKRDAMGIVLKRRDNAPIVKHVFGNVIEKIMIDKDFDLAVSWLKETLKMIRNGEFILRHFVVTKALRGYYKNPQGIAHKVLADRMAERDPGNKPKANDRIPYAYIKVNEQSIITGYKMSTERRLIGKFKNGKPRYKNFRVEDLEQPKYKKQNILQGDRIEHIDFIKENKLNLDYELYISNQIMNPVKQVLDLVLNPEETQKLFQ
tara:strand:+ start:815 stop:4702 length:3888 start_codon:yes stop_codon:yes gene_type:complete